MQYTNTQSRRRRLRRRMPVRLGLVLALVIGVATTVDTSGLHSPASVRSAPEVTTHRARHSVDDIKRRALRGTARPIAPRSAFNQPGPLPPRVEQARWVTHAGRTVLAEPDQLIVRFRHEVDTATRDAFVAELGGRIVYASRYTGATLIRLTDPDDLEVALHALDRSGLAHDATPNAVTMGAAWSWGWPSSTSKSTSSTSTSSKSSSSASSSSASSGGSSWSFSFGSSWSSGSSWGSSSDWSAWWGSPGDWSGWWSGFNWSNWNAWKDWSTGVDWASGTWGQVPDSVVPDAQVSLLDGGATTAGAGTVSEKWDASGLTMAVYVGTTGPTSKPYYPYEWHLHRQFAASGWERAPDMGKDVRIAILDSGISNTPSLGQARILPGANFIDPTKGTADDNGHGSHMANAACGSGRIVGVAPKSLMIPVKVLDADLSGTELALAEGIYFAVDDAGAQVISMSLTFPAGYVPSALLAEAITYAAEAGVVLVGAAGNEGSDTVAY
ncbi:MAG: hypothetical protein R3F39_18340, partial [Myxococcota bacterium]